MYSKGVFLGIFQAMHGVQMKKLVNPVPDVVLRNSSTDVLMSRSNPDEEDLGHPLRKTTSDYNHTTCWAGDAVSQVVILS